MRGCPGYSKWQGELQTYKESPFHSTHPAVFATQLPTMRLTKSPWLHLLQAYSAVAHPSKKPSSASDFRSTCSSITSKLQIPNITPYFSTFVPAGTNLTLPDSNVTCGTPYQIVPADLCRIALYVSTSNRSGINMEAWLPSNWTGRFLSVGNGGLAGCISYGDLAYSASLGFASVGANNGHNGTSGGAFYNNEDVVKDFAWRS